MASSPQQSFPHKLYLVGCRACDRGSNLAGHPAVILLIGIFCAAWFAIGGHATENTLTLILSVLAITLTQMVLNQQRRSEVALHLKIDELIIAVAGARDELAGIEHKDEDELEALRRDEAGEHAEERIEETSEQSCGSDDSEISERADQLLADRGRKAAARA